MSLQFLQCMLTAFFHVLMRHNIVQHVPAKYLEITSNSSGTNLVIVIFCSGNGLVACEPWAKENYTPVAICIA